MPEGSWVSLPPNGQPRNASNGSFRVHCRLRPRVGPIGGDEVFGPRALAGHAPDESSTSRDDARGHNRLEKIQFLESNRHRSRRNTELSEERLNKISVEVSGFSEHSGPIPTRLPLGKDIAQIRSTECKGSGFVQLKSVGSESQVEVLTEQLLWHEKRRREFVGFPFYWRATCEIVSSINRTVTMLAHWTT